jgi:GR25 family glycosyltransferase involved in LPS biosynthesis
MPVLANVLRPRATLNPSISERANATLQLPYAGYYINLERSASRRASVEGQLRALGLERTYSRFAAVEGRDAAGVAGSIASGEYGCFASHAQLLSAAAVGTRHVHVLEDDVLLSPELPLLIGTLVTRGALDSFDLIFTDTFVPLDPPHIRFYEQAYRGREPLGRQPALLQEATVIDLKGVYWACTSSYVAAQRSLKRIAALLNDALRAGPSEPVDIYLRHLVNNGELKAAVCLPFVTSIDLALDLDTTISRGAVGPDLTRLACNIVRHSYFVRPDLEAIRRITEQFFPVGVRTARGETIARMLEFAVFGEYRTSF